MASTTVKVALEIFNDRYSFYL